MIGIRSSALKETRAPEYLLRFLFGGSATVLAGLVAQHWGPVVGGLFLAFPAIFPASATLIESHEKERKAGSGGNGTQRGRFAASIDSSGTALGCLGLLGFALVLWKMLPRHSASEAIPVATIVWAVIAFASWRLRRSRLFRRGTRLVTQHRL